MHTSVSGQKKYSQEKLSFVSKDKTRENTKYTD